MDVPERSFSRSGKYIVHFHVGFNEAERSIFLGKQHLLSAVYEDLRYRILLSPEEEQRGSEAFPKLFCRLERTSGDVEQESRSVPDNGNSDDDEFERK